MDMLTADLIKQLNNVPRLFEVYDIRIHPGANRENNWIDITHPMIKPISVTATWAIFTDRGHVNRLAIRDLRSAGYTVIPGEVDKNYGWLSAGIIVPDYGVILVDNDNLDNRWKRRG